MSLYATCPPLPSALQHDQAATPGATLEQDEAPRSVCCDASMFDYDRGLGVCLGCGELAPAHNDPEHD